jgi:hypothetical protein
VLVEWENGEIMTEPLSVIAANNPVTCAVYAREHDLLDVEGWKHFQNLAKHEKHFLRLITQAKMKSYDNFRMNTGYGRYGAPYNMVGLICFHEELPCV